MSAYDALNKVAAAQVVTANAVAAAVPMVPCETHNEATAYVNVTAASGTTPTVLPTLESSPDGVVWATHTAGAAMTAAGSQMIKAAGNIGRFVRLNFLAVGGTTPSFTIDAWIDTKRIGA